MVAHERVRMVALHESALDVSAVIASVDDPRAGGTDVFIGTVRDHDGGRDVIGLGYSAHPSAVERLREVCARVADRHEVHALSAVHRVGDLAIGDVAVVVATSASHRSACFAATRDLIDTLKSEVPIWKHQRFTQGDDSWVGTP